MLLLLTLLLLYIIYATASVLINLLHEGAALQSAGDIAGARVLYEQAAELNADHPDLLHLRGLCSYAEGDVSSAAAQIADAVKMAPQRHDIWSNLGEMYRQLGNAELSLRANERAVSLRPDVLQNHFNLGVALAHFGHRDTAAAAYNRVLELDGNHINALENLSELLATQQRLTEAANLLFRMQRALGEVHDIRWSQAALQLGVIHHRLGELDGALTHYTDAVAVVDSLPGPNQEERETVRWTALINTGAVHQASGRFGAAVELYRRVLAFAPPGVGDCGAHNNLGSSLWQLGHHDDAEAHYLEALRLTNGACIEAHVNLGVAHYERGDRKAARDSYCAALMMDPDRGGLEVRIATMMTPVIPHAGRDGISTERAEILLAVKNLIVRAGGQQQYSSIRPASVETDISRECRDATSPALVITDPMAQVERMHFYLVYHGRNELTNQRAMVELFSRSSAPGLRYVSPMLHPAYKVSDEDMQPRRRIRVGFASKFFHENHAHGQLLSGIMARLDRRRYAITVIAFPNPAGGPSIAVRAALGIPPKEEEMQQLDVAGRSLVSGVKVGSKSARLRGGPYDRLIELDTLNIQGVRRSIAEANLDVLIFADSMSEPLNYFLQWGRMAPVQAAFWGNPLTTGGAESDPNGESDANFAPHQIDYFISGDWLEPPRAAHEHYGEQLIRLGGTGIWYDDIPVPFDVQTSLETEAKLSRQARQHRKAARRAKVLNASLPNLVAAEQRCVASSNKNKVVECDTVVMLVAQSVFKLHPAFDRALASILGRALSDTSTPSLDVHLVLLQGRQSKWTEALKQRLAAAFEHNMPSGTFNERVHFHPRVKGSDAFLRLIATADLLLHPFPFGGSKTSADGLLLGIPTLTMRGAFLRGRMAHSFYRFLGAGLGLLNEDEEAVPHLPDLSPHRLVARNASDYVSLALRLLRSRSLRDEISAVLRERAGNIFENEHVVEEWDMFLYRVACSTYSSHRYEGGKQDLPPWLASLPPPDRVLNNSNSPSSESFLDQQKRMLAKLLKIGLSSNNSGDLVSAQTALLRAVRIARGLRKASAISRGQPTITSSSLASILNDLGAVQQQLALSGGGNGEYQPSLEDALGQFRAALSLRWIYPLAHNNLAVTLQEMGRMDEANSHYRISMEQSENDEAELLSALPGAGSSAAYNYGNMLRDQGRFHDAAALYAETLSLPALVDSADTLVIVPLALLRPPESIDETEELRSALQKLGSELYAKHMLSKLVAATLSTTVLRLLSRYGKHDLVNNLSKLLYNNENEGVVQSVPWTKVFTVSLPETTLSEIGGVAASVITRLGELKRKHRSNDELSTLSSTSWQGAAKEEARHGNGLHLIVQIYEPRGFPDVNELTRRLSAKSRLGELIRCLALNLLNPYASSSFPHASSAQSTHDSRVILLGCM